MAKKYYVFDLSDNIMEEFDNKTDANNYITELLPDVDDSEATIVVIYGDLLEFDIKAFIKKEG